MPFDYKKEYKAFYAPKNKPELVTVPPMNFVAVRGCGDPNASGGDYAGAMGLLYGVSFTIKMSKLGDRQIEGYFDYVVPPLEGFWWMEGQTGIDFGRKAEFQWISAIRLPDFVTKADFDWAVETAAQKKKQDFSRAEFWHYEEGLCVQCMHLGPYDDEPATIGQMERFLETQGCVTDLTGERRHHEIYLSDPRRCAPERLKTVIRIPVRRCE